MENLYLKEVEFEDLELLIEYDKDFKKHFPNKKNSINEDTFESWLKKLKQSQEDSSKMHLFPYWIMKYDKAIGLSILKTNIKSDKEFEKYSGHVSYVIAPSYRMKGYGTECLHLALEKCKTLGLDKVFISCDDKNIASANIIENNYGILHDVCIYNGEQNRKGDLYRRYLIDVNESLMLYEQKNKRIKTTLKQICNLDRSNLDDFLINSKQSQVGEEILSFSQMIGDINSIEDVAKLYKIFKEEFDRDSKQEMEKFKRTTEEIVKSRIYSGCNDAGLVLSTILRLKGIPTVFVSSAHTSWIKNHQEQNEDARKVQGHIFLEIYLNNKWYLFDSMAGMIYDNYDYTNLSLPKDYYVFRKTLNNHNFGAYTLEDDIRIMQEIFKDFDLNEYKNPEYDCIDLRELSKEIKNRN